MRKKMLKNCSFNQDKVNNDDGIFPTRGSITIQVLITNRGILGGNKCY
jgi:hypothetical protein